MADAMTLTAPAQQLESSNQQQSESVSPNASLYETSSNETGQISAANTSGVNMNSTLDSLVDNLEGLSPASNGSGGSLGRGGTNGLSGDTTGQFGAMVGGRAGDGDSYGKMGENDSFFSGDATYNSLLNTLCAANWSQAPPARSGPTFQQSMSVPCGQQGGNAGANPAHFNLNDSGIDIGNLSLQIGLLNLTQAADSALFSGGAQPQKGSPRNESVHQSRGGGHSGWPNFSGNANASELLVNASAANWGSGPQSNANAALMNMSRQTSGVSSLATPFNTSSSAQNSPSGELLKNRSSRDMASAQAPDGAYAPLESQLLELIRAQQGAGAAGPNLFASLPGASFGGGAQNGAPAALGRSYSHSGAQLGNQSLLGSSGPFGNASGSASSLIDPNLLALLGRQSREQYAEHAQQQFAPPTQQQRGRARGRAHAHHATAVEHYGAERLGSHPHAHAFGAARTGGSGTGFDRSGGGPVAGLLNSYQQAVAQSGVMQQHVNTGANAHMHGESRGAERFSRKVFVGGLPPDVDEDEIAIAFSRFGSLVVDWPHKAESKSYFPPKGYCFLLFHDEASVHALLDSCVLDGGKYYWVVSSPTVRDKPVSAYLAVCLRLHYYYYTVTRRHSICTIMLYFMNL